MWELNNNTKSEYRYYLLRQLEESERPKAGYPGPGRSVHPEYFNKITKLPKIAKRTPNWILKNIHDKRQTKFALILIKEEKLKHNYTLKIELHKLLKKPQLDEQLSLIKSPVSILEPLLLVPKLEKLKELKTDALLDRKKARDVFDLWYISQVLKEKFELPKKKLAYGRREFKNELQVFLPKKYYPVVDQLYEQITK